MTGYTIRRRCSFSHPTALTWLSQTSFYFPARNHPCGLQFDYKITNDVKGAYKPYSTSIKLDEREVYSITTRSRQLLSALLHYSFLFILYSCIMRNNHTCVHYIIVYSILNTVTEDVRHCVSLEFLAAPHNASQN